MNSPSQNKSPFMYYENSHIPNKGTGFSIEVGKCLAANRAKRARTKFFDYVQDLLNDNHELCTEERFRSILAEMGRTGQTDVAMNHMSLVCKLSEMKGDRLRHMDAINNN